MPGATPDGAVLAGVAAPLLTPQAKHALRERTGADLVDTESHVFASICADRAVQWAIIRGVSDGPDDALPRRVSEWVDERGRSRPGRVALDLLRRPLLIPRVHRLGRSTGAALRAASALLDTLLESLPATIPSP